MSITAKNFKGRLGMVIKSITSQRDAIQALIVFGLEHYKEHGNTTYLTMLLESCINVKALPTITLKDYIQKHANVSWSKVSGGEVFAFKKVGKDIDVKGVKQVWYEWSGAKHNVKDMDVLAQTRGLLTRITKAISEGKVKNIDEANKISDALKSSLSA